VPPGEEAAAKRPAGDPPTYDVRHYLAEERTFLAWIRTILGLMGFGFLVAHIDRSFLAFGTALIVVGAALSLLAVQRHRRVVEELNHPQATADHPSRQGVFLALFLAVAGIAMALYLILSWSSPA
jgi:inner membrane protein YidH